MPTDHELREVVVGTDDGALRGKVAVPTGPMRLSGLAATAYALANAVVERATRLVVLENRTISCGPGCGACCRHMVPVSIPEALRVAEVLDALPEAQRERFMQRFESVAAALSEARLVERLLDPELTADPVLPVAREYFALQQACPFLEDESCGIHADRPVACRDYNVTSPAAWCREPYTHDIEKVPTPLPMSVPLARAAAAALSEPARLIPLTLVPRWVAEHTALRTRTWPGPALFDALLKELRVLYPPEGGAEN